MNVFVPENPRVRIWKEKSTGRIMQVETNVHPTVVAEVVEVADGEAIVTVDERIEGNMTFGCRIEAPTLRK